MRAHAAVLYPNSSPSLCLSVCVAEKKDKVVSYIGEGMSSVVPSVIRAECFRCHYDDEYIARPSA